MHPIGHCSRGAELMYETATTNLVAMAGGRWCQRSWRDNPDTLARVEEVYRRHILGQTARRISEALGVSRVTVHRDVKRGRGLVVRSTARRLEAARADSIARITELQRMALDGYEDDRDIRRIAAAGTLEKMRIDLERLNEPPSRDDEFDDIDPAELSDCELARLEFELRP